MSEEIINSILLSITFASLFAVAELLHVFLKIKAEITRKIVHIGTGIVTLFFPILIKSPFLILILCGSFAIILTLSQRFNLLKGINGIDRKSYGSISYPLAVFSCYLFYYFQSKELILFYLPILILAISDPIAAFVGKRTQFIPLTIFGDLKTIGGFIGFMVSSIMITSFLLYLLPHSHINSITLILCCTISSAVSELITPKGLDNITIPISVMGSILLAQL